MARHFQLLKMSGLIRRGPMVLFLHQRMEFSLWAQVAAPRETGSLFGMTGPENVSRKLEQPGLFLILRYLRMKNGWHSDASIHRQETTTCGYWISSVKQSHDLPFARLWMMTLSGHPTEVRFFSIRILMDKLIFIKRLEPEPEVKNFFSNRR